MYVLKKIGVLKSALFNGCIGAVAGFIAGIIMAIISTLILGAISSAGGVDPFAASPLMGLGWMGVVVLPIVYGIGGFIGGALMTWVANLILKLIKGIDLELEQVQVAQSMPQKKA